MPKQFSGAAFSAIFIFAAGISAIGLFTPRHESVILFLAYFSAFFAYFWLCTFSLDFKTILGLGIATRSILFFSLPGLSDDFYRFLWDGTLLANGTSPFAELPGYYIAQESFSGLTPELFERINSPQYFTVYPPLHQFFFWLGVIIGKTSWLTGVNAMRVFLLLSEIGSFIVLRKLLLSTNKDPLLANWYFLNPLLILESTGNLHFEGMVICFILFGLYLISRGKNIAGGVAFGLAIAVKLLPLIFLPALLFRKDLKTGILISTIAIVAAGITFLPILHPDLLSGMQQSLELYFRKFEFNASIYFVLREIGTGLYGYNPIGTLGPWLSVISFLTIISLAILGYRKQWPLAKTLLFILSAYLLLATTVHPWYILPLIPLGILSGYYFPIVWSFLIFVTYFGYAKAGYELSLLWIVFEYITVLFVFMFESLKVTYARRP